MQISPVKILSHIVKAFLLCRHFPDTYYAKNYDGAIDLGLIYGYTKLQSFREPFMPELFLAIT